MREALVPTKCYLSSKTIIHLIPIDSTFHQAKHHVTTAAILYFQLSCKNWPSVCFITLWFDHIIKTSLINCSQPLLEECNSSSKPWKKTRSWERSLKAATVSEIWAISCSSSHFQVIKISLWLGNRCLKCITVLSGHSAGPLLPSLASQVQRTWRAHGDEERWRKRGGSINKLSAEVKVWSTTDLSLPFTES